MSSTETTDFEWFVEPTTRNPFGISRRPRPNQTGPAGLKWDWRVGTAPGAGWNASDERAARQFRSTRNRLEN